MPLTLCPKYPFLSLPPSAQGWYAESFADFRAFPPIKDNLDVVRFTAMLKNAFRRHNNVVPAIAKGVEVYKRALEVGRKGVAGFEIGKARRRMQDGSWAACVPRMR